MPSIEVYALRFRQLHSKRKISLALLGLMLLPGFSALAEDNFGAEWQPKPLVDTSAPAVVPQSQALSSHPGAPVAPSAQPDLEAKLKPVEPFIREVENRLTLKPKPGVTLVQRLNTLQTVLFGAQKYQDAGELISKLAEVFPQEAQKAQAELEKQYQTTMQANAAPSNVKAGTPSTRQAAGPTYAPTQTAMTQQPVAKKKRSSFWGGDDFNSDFDNDPFFQDTYQGRVRTSGAQGGVTTQSTTSQNGFTQQSNTQQSFGSPANSQQSYGGQTNMQQSNGPSRLSTIAQGLGGLALAVGGMAGAYYMNNKMSGGNRGYGNNYGYPNTGYGYPNTGYGYGYNGVSPYGVGMSPYGTGVSPYGGATMMPYGAGITPYGSGITPYGAAGITPYGAGITPYGYPTNVSPYPGSTYNYNGRTYGQPTYNNYSGSGFSGSAFGMSGGNISPLGVPGF